MKYLKYLWINFVLTGIILHAQCKIPGTIVSLLQKTPLHSLKKYNDIRRNYSKLKKMCVHKVTFKEGRYRWKMLLVTNEEHPVGPFWFLPHDDENTAFDSAVYATKKYGGGFLAVMAEDERYYKGQDPNRNFGDTYGTARRCNGQKTPAPKYSRTVFRIINTYRAKYVPYLALHNNKNGWEGNGGEGKVSILRSSKKVQSYAASRKIYRGNGGLKDEDTMVYIMGTDKKPNRNKLRRLLRSGINTKYEVVNSRQNDCSLSNYIWLKGKTTHYYNIETQHGDARTQRKIIDKIMRMYGVKKL
ncbi:hypothetical protein [Sulfurovum riftiae]|uniref:Uncharacterized protein n=1 Tax=Sulfurovum riftiae TaxID=1630136 RepID=A0A151CGF9_9BACT|nr:hypothetical protein [Sulfurovum riftiae]KYJ86514.1 hypothetical protein AS592_06825 [Sulfurovum riftiae]